MVLAAVHTASSPRPPDFGNGPQDCLKMLVEVAHRMEQEWDGERPEPIEDPQRYWKQREAPFLEPLMGEPPHFFGPCPSSVPL